MTSAAEFPVTPGPLAEGNIRYLEQGIALLSELDDREYGDPLLPGFSQGIGAHVRHVIDHYSSFLAGVDSGSVDYDARERSPLLESDRRAAIARLRELAAELRRLPAALGDQTLDVVLDCGGDTRLRQCSRSSVARELQFLLSHTVHHYALLAAALAQRGKAVPEGLGLAPSTLRYQQSAR